MIERTILRRAQASPRPLLPGLSLPQQRVIPEQAVRLAMLVFGIALLTFILYLYVLPNSQMAEARARIAALRADTAAVTRQNAELVKEISVHAELSALARRAQALGMGPPQSALFLESPPPSAAPGRRPSIQPGDNVATPSLGQPPWLDSVQDHLANFLERAGVGLKKALGSTLR